MVYNHLTIVVCQSVEEAIEKGFNYSDKAEEFNPIKIDKVVVVRNGMASGKSTADFILEDDTGKKFVFMLSSELLKSIPSL